MAKSIKLTLDWDGTLTRNDTMFMMGKIAGQRDRRLGLSKDSTKTWENFGAAYMEDFATHQKSYIPVKSERRNPESEALWLQSLRGVEDRSALRVHKSGFFKGVTHDDLNHAARDAIQSDDVVVRPGWEKLFIQAAAAKSGDFSHGDIHVHEISVLSVNWSEAFIRESLRLSADRHARLDEGQRQILEHFVANMSILANEIEGLNASEGSTGVLHRAHRLAVRTNLDKLQYFTRSQDLIHVYVGDSSTDLDCLLNADIGICIRDESMGSSQSGLAEALHRVKVSVRHVSDQTHGQGLDDIAANAQLWWARDFDEIATFLSLMPHQ